MSLIQTSIRTRQQSRAGVRPRAHAKAIKSSWEFDRVTVLAVLAACGVFTPFALVILHQAAQIFAH